MHIYYAYFHYIYYILNIRGKKKEAVKTARRIWQIYIYSFTNCQEISDSTLWFFFERESILPFRSQKYSWSKEAFFSLENES